MEQTLEVLQAI